MTAADPLPVTGAWREGDPVAGRRFADVGPLDTELSGHLPAVRVAYETWGTLSEARDNAILVLHALTGDAHAVGEAGPGQPTAGWWDGLIGPGQTIDTDRWFVVSSNALGGCQGTTGPSSTAPDGRAYGSRFPRITVRDQVEVEVRLADHLGIERYASVIGGSMGGMRGLEWLAGHPDRVGSALLLATGAAASADQIATQSLQIEAITSDAGWHGGDYYDAPTGPGRGMAIARRIAHLTYRTEMEMQSRFGREPQAGEDPYADGRFAIQSYLDHQAAKLLRRFDAGTYVALSDAMNTHDLDRGRVRDPLADVTVPVRVVGIDSDRLYPLWQQARIADRLGVELDVIRSPFGHDAFLLEIDEVGRIVGELLDARVGASR